MNERCSNPKKDYFSCYGGRGIKVNSSWKSFDIFREWALENGYANNLSLDRIDNALNYNPKNCRWVSKHYQFYNKGSNKLTENIVKELRQEFKLSGENITSFSKQKAYKFNCSYITIYYALKRKSWKHLNN